MKSEGVVCADGYLFDMGRRGYLTSVEFVPEVALENPDALKILHQDFQHASSDVIEAFTYNGHREMFEETALDPLYCNRYEMRDFAVEAWKNNLALMRWLHPTGTSPARAPFLHLQSKREQLR